MDIGIALTTLGAVSDLATIGTAIKNWLFASLSNPDQVKLINSTLENLGPGATPEQIISILEPLYSGKGGSVKVLSGNFEELPPKTPEEISKIQRDIIDQFRAKLPKNLKPDDGRSMGLLNWYVELSKKQRVIMWVAALIASAFPVIGWFCVAPWLVPLMLFLEFQHESVNKKKRLENKEG